MARDKGKSGLDALFSKVFDSDNVKGAISTMHDDFGSTPSPIVTVNPVEAPPVSVNVPPVTVKPVEVVPVVTPPALPPALRVVPHVGKIPETGDVVAPSKLTALVSETSISDGGIFDRQIVHGKIDNGQTVNYTTVEPSTIPPSTIQQSHISPSDSLPSDSQLYHGQTSPIIEQGHISDGGISDHQNNQQNLTNTFIQNIPQDVLSLPYNQAAVFEYLVNAGGLTSMRAISDVTHVGVPSVKDAVSRLVRRGFLHNPVTIRSASFQGFSYVLNYRMVEYFMSAGGLEQTKYGTIRPSNSPPSDSQLSHRDISNPMTVEQSTISPLNSQPSDGQLVDGPTVHSSSVFKESKDLTTTKTQATVEPSTIRPSDTNLQTSTEAFVLTGIPGMFWEGEGLQEGQAKKWCEQFEMDPTQLRLQLEWARWDMETNNKRKEVRKDPISWFFGVLRATGGCYPRPANYKSPAEIRAEMMEQELAREKAAKDRLRVAELDQQFQQVLTDPAAESYQFLLSLVGGFEKEMGGEVLEKALRTVFLKQNGIEVQ